MNLPILLPNKVMMFGVALGILMIGLLQAHPVSVTQRGCGAVLQVMK
jgi:hypothetical protein